MIFRLLGAVEVHASGQLLALGPPRRRCLLAVLAADAGRPVMVDTAVHRLWGEERPARARNTLYVHIARLRQALDTVAGDDGPAVIVRRSGGYLLDVEPERVDVHRFHGLVRKAQDKQLTDADRSLLLREALDLWRGTPMADLSGGWVERTRAAWCQHYLTTTLAWAQAELGTGHAERVVGPLTELLDEHPLAENVAAALMRALHATGHRAEALDHYLRMRRRLVRELGTDPGAELRELQRQILLFDDGPSARAPGSAAATAPAQRTGPSPVAAATTHPPRQLPLAPAGFTGRRRVLEELDAAIHRAAATPTAAVVVAVTGTAGVGKTSLAVHWAHRSADAFPDGQLYLDLRGYHADQPLEPGAGLAALLGALGVPPGAQPAGTEERAALFRSVVAERRLLILLDNASSVAQVRPLLPGSRSCFVVVTSRDTLAGLVARDGAHRIPLDVLPLNDAVALLRATIGDAVGRDPIGAVRLADLCARLPLALRLAAEIAAGRPELGLTELLTDLTDERRRLDLLDTSGDQQSAIRAVFSWSYGTLPAEIAAAFRRTALHPGPTVDRHAVAALAGVDLPAADRALITLARAHLVTQPRHGRYAMHDLLRLYAASLADESEDPADRPAAVLGRLYDFHLRAAAAALDTLYPAEATSRPAPPPSDAPVPVFDEPDDARRWLDCERSVLTSAATARDVVGWADRARWLSDALYRYLDGGHHADGLRIHGDARDAAIMRADRLGEARALLGLGAAHLWRGEVDEAADCFRRSLAADRHGDDGIHRVRALNSLGVIERRRGRYDKAARVQEEAAALAVQNADVTGEARALNNLAVTEHLRGRSHSAADHFYRALALFTRAGDFTGQANTLHNLGKVEVLRGRAPAAVDRLRRALALYRRLGNLRGEATTLDSLGGAYTAAGHADCAAGYFEASLAIFRRIGEAGGVASACNGLGEVAQVGGRPDVAAEHYAAALASAGGSIDQRARAHRGLAAACRARGDRDEAVAHYERAVDLYHTLGAAEADEVLAAMVELARS